MPFSRVVTRTPLRVSFVGGGTDLRDYYARDGERPGTVVSLAIARYCYVTVRPRAGHASEPRRARHDDGYVARLERAATEIAGCRDDVVVHVASDGPTGAGLGASSSLAVGLVHALAVASGERPEAEDVAERACALEIGALGRPIGKQDAYIAAYGGFRHFVFHADERVTVRTIECEIETRTALLQRLLLFFTGVTRDAAAVLSATQARLRADTDTYEVLGRIGALVPSFIDCIEGGDPAAAGPLLHAAWTEKKRTTPAVTTPWLDRLYDTALAAGATGGKVLGAGHGGCLLLVAEPADHGRVRERLAPLGVQELPMALAPEGSTVMGED